MSMLFALFTLLAPGAHAHPTCAELRPTKVNLREPCAANACADD